MVRVVIGLYVAAHGAQKLFGWFGGPGFKGTQGFMGGMLGFRPSLLWTIAVTVGELGGGLLMALGLLGPVGPIGVAATMVVASMTHWGKGPFAMAGGYELPLTYLAAALAVAFGGVGAYSVDTWLGIVVPAQLSLATAVLSTLGVVAAVGTRTVPATKPAVQTT
jgi:putative oxidoreductase